MRAEMYLVRIVNNNVQTYEVVPYEVRGNLLRKRKPRAWRFGAGHYKVGRRLYPCRAEPGVAALAESWGRAYDMAIELTEAEAA